MAKITVYRVEACTQITLYRGSVADSEFFLPEEHDFPVKIQVSKKFSILFDPAYPDLHALVEEGAYTPVILELVKCRKCSGSGKYLSERGGTYVCAACSGKGVQSPDDVERDRAYVARETQRSKGNRVLAALDREVDGAPQTKDGRCLDCGTKLIDGCCQPCTEAIV